MQSCPLGSQASIKYYAIEIYLKLSNQKYNLTFIINIKTSRYIATLTYIENRHINPTLS